MKSTLSTRLNLRVGLGAVAFLLSTFVVSHAAPPPPRVDVLVCYTPAARAYAGGANAMKAAINACVAQTNLAYVNSDIPIVLKLAGTAEISYTEAGDLGTDLARLANPSDGNIDSVHTLRNTVGADLVCLIRRDAAAGAAGIGYLGGGAVYGFTVVADIYASSNISFAHELGHNLGCNHDRQNTGSTAGYNYGYRFNGNNAVQYRTIMAYAPGSRIGYFSNPSITYQGVATGVASGSTAADNAQQIETSRDTVVAYRAARTSAPSHVRGDIDGDGYPDIVLFNADTGQVIFWIMSGEYRATSIALAPIGTGWQLATTGDLNGDGYSDIVLESTVDRTRLVWFMQGTTRLSTGTLPTPLMTWRIATSGDFNADGKDDLVMQNTSDGSRVVWYMNGATRIGVASLPSAATTLSMSATGDFNGDGRPDIILDSTADGTHVVWYMNDTVRTGTASLPATSAPRTTGGTGDFNLDGAPDLLMDNVGSGSRALWYMSGVTRTSGVTLPALTSVWHISNH